jgi:transposase
MAGSAAFVRLLEVGVHEVLAVVRERGRWHDRSRLSRASETARACSWTRPSCGRIRMRRVRVERGGQEIGRSRGGPSTKVHAVVDALGNPVRLVLSPGQTHEMKLAADMLAYSSAALIAELEGRGRTVVIGNKPTHRRREIDTHLQNERSRCCTIARRRGRRRGRGRERRRPRRAVHVAVHVDVDGPGSRICRPIWRERFLVENFFQRIERWRRVAMRFERRARNYLAFLHLASILVWLA